MGGNRHFIDRDPCRYRNTLLIHIHECSGTGHLRADTSESGLGGKDFPVGGSKLLCHFSAQEKHTDCDPHTQQHQQNNDRAYPAAFLFLFALPESLKQGIILPFHLIHKSAPLQKCFLSGILPLKAEMKLK